MLKVGLFGGTVGVYSANYIFGKCYSCEVHVLK